MGMRKLYIEGGGDQKRLKSECRRAFAKFFEKAGFKGNMPRIVACGGRQSAYDDFCIAVRRLHQNESAFLLVDAEESVLGKNMNHPWNHLKSRDNWDKPDFSPLPVLDIFFLERIQCYDIVII